MDVQGDAAGRWGVGVRMRWEGEREEVGEGGNENEEER